jgi:hypothetical protein
MQKASSREALDAIKASLLAIRPEIEQSVFTRVYGVADPTETPDPQYLVGLKAAVFAAIDYGFAALEGGSVRAQPVPVELLVQARLAARNGVSLDTVLRRYFGGYTVFRDALVEEAARIEGLSAEELNQLLRDQAAAFDALLAAVSEEHSREEAARIVSAEGRRVNLVERLLAGEPVDDRELAYDLGGQHLAVVGTGPEAGASMRTLLEPLEARLLQVRPHEEAGWLWLGSRRPLDPEELKEVCNSKRPAGLCLGIGEPGEGLQGWRLSHWQAAAALGVALEDSEPVTRYAEVALVASIVKDRVLSASLRRLYLAPLERARDGGEAARETLRAYFSAGQNLSSAASLLGIHRRTVAARLQAVEEQIGKPLGVFAVEIELALRLAEHDSLGVG